jgi:FtsP/CotA-like multicopper oxidase with cupredoxin domain
MFNTRRQFLKTASAAGIGLLSPLGFAGSVSADESSSWFKNPLGIPPLETGKVINGKRVISLSLGYGTSAFLGDRPTATVGINGAYLGPVIRVRQGDDVELKVTNRLTEASTLHWHGLNIPAAIPGMPLSKFYRALPRSGITRICFTAPEYRSISVSRDCSTSMMSTVRPWIYHPPTA